MRVHQLDTCPVEVAGIACCHNGVPGRCYGGDLDIPDFDYSTLPLTTRSDSSSGLC